MSKEIFHGQISPEITTCTCRYLRVWNKWHIIEHLDGPVNTSYSRVIRVIIEHLDGPVNTSYSRVIRVIIEHLDGPVNTSYSRVIRVVEHLDGPVNTSYSRVIRIVEHLDGPVNTSYSRVIRVVCWTLGRSCEHQLFSSYTGCWTLGWSCEHQLFSCYTGYCLFFIGSFYWHCYQDDFVLKTVDSKWHTHIFKADGCVEITEYSTTYIADKWILGDPRRGGGMAHT